VEVVKLEEVYELAAEYAEACVGAVCCRVGQVLVVPEAAGAFGEGAQEWREELYKASKDGRLFVVLKKEVGSEGGMFVLSVGVSGLNNVYCRDFCIVYVYNCLRKLLNDRASK